MVSPLIWFQTQQSPDQTTEASRWCRERDLNTRPADYEFEAMDEIKRSTTDRYGIRGMRAVERSGGEWKGGLVTIGKCPKSPMSAGRGGFTPPCGSD
jgi:hypothetical protein